MIQEFSSPTRPSFFPLARMTESTSGRFGMKTAVTTRPTRRSPGLITFQPASNWLRKPASCKASQASSAVTSFSARARSRRLRASVGKALTAPLRREFNPLLFGEKIELGNARKWSERGGRTESLLRETFFLSSWDSVQVGATRD